MPESITPLGAALRTALDGPLAELRAQAREDFPSERMYRDPGATLEEARAYTLDRLAELADGVVTDGLPTGATDTGDPARALVSFEAGAWGDLSVSIKAGVQFGLFGGAIFNLGTDGHRDTYLADVKSLALLGAYAMTEKGHGSDVASLETTITYDPATREFVVDSPTPSSVKTYLGNAAAHGRMATVYGQLYVDGTCHGVHCVLVPIRVENGDDLPGVTTGDNGHKGGLLGVDNGTLEFDHVRVPREALLDRYGGVTEEGVYSSSIENPNRRFFTMLGTLVRGRVCIGAGAGIAARRGLSLATRYALMRRQFEAPGHEDGVLLLDYLTHQRKLLIGIAQAYALGFAQNDLSRALLDVQTGVVSGDRVQRELESFAAGMKAITTRFANDILQTCRESCGGAGYMSENGLTQLRADTDVFATFEGDNTVLLQLVAKGLLSNYGEAWNQLDVFGVALATARTVGRLALDRTPARQFAERILSTARRRNDQVSVLDRGWQMLMFQERAERVLDSLARRVQAARRIHGKQSFEALNLVQDHMLLAAQAHLDAIVLRSFIAGIQATEEPVTRALLNKVCDLYALNVLDGDRAWFLERNLMSVPRTRALRAAVNRLCGELRSQALPLVEGLGIKKEWLDVPMLRD